MARARRRWGWHRLTPDWAERLVVDAGVGPGDLVLDIGAGTGALTGPLLASGARVIAVESHPGRRSELRTRFAARLDDRRLVVIGADAADLRLPRRPFDVVANPPFAVTSALLGRLLHRGSRLRRAHLVLQHGAARRAVERPTDQWDLRLGRRVPRSAFAPPPRVDTTVLVVRRRDQRGSGR